MIPKIVLAIIMSIDNVSCHTGYNEVFPVMTSWKNIPWIRYISKLALPIFFRIGESHLACFDIKMNAVKKIGRRNANE